MAAGTYKLVIEQGATFSRTLIFGQGAKFDITSFADAGGGSVTVNAAGHTFVDGNYVKIVAYDSDSSVSYTGSYLISGTVAGVSFAITATWQGTIEGTAQLARDLTDLSFRAEGRETYASTDVLATATCTIATPANGVVAMTISAVTTAAYTPIKGAVWAGELYDAADLTFVERVLNGPMDIDPEGGSK